MSRLARRLVSIPLLVVGLALSPVLFIVGLFLPSGVRAASMVTAWLVCELLGVLAALVLTPLQLWPARSLDAHYALQRAWSGTLWWALRRLYRIDLQVRGEAGSGPFLLLVRHASTADTLLPQILLANPTGIRLRYVLKHELRWDPCLDVVGDRVPNAFVRRGEGQLDAVRDLAEPGSSTVVWPEGTRFTASRLARSTHPRAEELSATLPPRTGAVRAVLERNPTDVVFVAHRGFEGVRGMDDLWNGRLLDARVQVQIWRATPDPDVESWLFDQWKRVDRVAVAGFDTL